MKWNASLYDDKHSYVSKYGQDLVSLLRPQNGESILDLGCGTGDLAFEISQSGASVFGIDSSPDMIEKAKNDYPSVEFEVADAANFSFDKKFDAVFSNATMHWVNDQKKAISCVYQSLKPNGRFVLEMGAKRNVSRIIKAIKRAMNTEGFGDKIESDFWFFPSLAEYSTLLEQQGFTVESAWYFDRDTPLIGENGMANWINMFGSYFFKNISIDQANHVIAKAVDYLKPTNHQNNEWYADYVRLRIKATKKIDSSE